MKRGLLLCALLALPLVSRAETVDLGTHGKFSVAVPDGWKYSVNQMEASGFAVTLTPPGTANASCLLTLVYVDNPEPLSKEKVQGQVLSACDQFVDQSVEKKKTLQEFTVPGAYGVYCLFTDASMVGKPPQKDMFKAVALGEVFLADDLTMSVSMLFDDANGPEFKAMLAAVSSCTVSKSK
jgi:hypothetical protein